MAQVSAVTGGLHKLGVSYMPTHNSPGATGPPGFQPTSPGWGVGGAEWMGSVQVLLTTVLNAIWILYHIYTHILCNKNQCFEK